MLQSRPSSQHRREVTSSLFPERDLDRLAAVPTCRCLRAEGRKKQNGTQREAVSVVRVANGERPPGVVGERAVGQE